MWLGLLDDASIGLDGVVLIGVNAFRRVSFFGGLLDLGFQLNARRGPYTVGYFVLLDCNLNFYFILNDRQFFVDDRANCDNVRFLGASVLEDRFDLGFLGALDFNGRFLDRELGNLLRLYQVVLAALRRDLRFDSLYLILFRLFYSRFSVEYCLLFYDDEILESDSADRVCTALNYVCFARSFLGLVRDARRFVRFNIPLNRLRRGEVVFYLRIFASAARTIAQDRRDYTCWWGYWLFRAVAFCIFG